MLSQRKGKTCPVSLRYDKYILLLESAISGPSSEGFGFSNAGHTPELVKKITTYLRDATPGGIYLIAGAPSCWRFGGHDADSDRNFLDIWLASCSLL